MDGADNINNVAALCADHHREAHFGKNADRIKSVLTEKITNKRPE